MTIEEIRKGAPEFATHYMESPINLGFECVTYFMLVDGKYFEYFSNHFARYETGVCHSLIKPLSEV